MTGGIIGHDDTLKVIDQGADDTTNAVSIRHFFERTDRGATTSRRRRRVSSKLAIAFPKRRWPRTRSSSTRCDPEPLRWLEPREAETRKMHALADYGPMYTKILEDIAQFGRVTTAYDYPVLVNGRYLMKPSPIPKFDNPKMDMNPAL